MRLAVFVSALFACATAGTRASCADPAPDARSSAVIVSSHIAAHKDAIGAGVIVGRVPGGLRILTARHVADAAYGDVTVWIDHAPYPAEIVRTFPHRDLAVVDALVPRSRTAALEPALRGGTAAAGQSVQIWGEDDDGPRLAQATVVALHSPVDDPQGVPLIGLACARCERGDSGGGLFSSDGRLLGIFTARLLTPDDRTVMFVAEPIDATLSTTPFDMATSAK